VEELFKMGQFICKKVFIVFSKNKTEMISSPRCEYDCPLYFFSKYKSHWASIIFWPWGAILYLFFDSFPFRMDMRYVAIITQAQRQTVHYKFPFYTPRQEVLTTWMLLFSFSGRKKTAKGMSNHKENRDLPKTTWEKTKFPLSTQFKAALIKT
jgi:hypothetical protein